MTAGTDATEPVTAAEAHPRWLGAARLVTGLAQGVAVSLLIAFERWGGEHPIIYAPLALCAVFLPPIWLSGLNAMRQASLAGWTAAAALYLTAAAVHDVLTRAPGPVRPGFDPGENGSGVAGPAVWFFSAVALFIAHHLIVPADQARRWRAPYAAYFEAGWKHAVQIALSLGFTGVAWGVLGLGAALFKLIGVDALADFLTSKWVWPAITGGLFAAAVHLTDLRAGLTLGVRNVVALLLSWLGPALAAIVAAFLLTLPFTGLQPLFATRSATATLLGAAVGLIVFVNAAYQGGGAAPGAVLRFSGCLSGVLVTPLIAIAVYALGLRIAQYGLTPERVVALAAVIVGSVYAIGYALAARPGRWMHGIEAANITAAVAQVLAIVALLTPIADPRRISVDDQIARFDRGVTDPEKLDVTFLRFDAGRYGVEALRTLAARRATPRDAQAAERAATALARRHRWEPPAAVPPARRAAQVDVHPSSATLPRGFLERDWGTAAPPCLAGASRCNAYLLDVDGDGTDEVLLSAQGGELTVYASAAGAWEEVGRFETATCPGVDDALRRGGARFAPSRWRDLEVGGVRVPFTPEASIQRCPSVDAGQPTIAAPRPRQPPPNPAEIAADAVPAPR